LIEEIVEGGYDTDEFTAFFSETGNVDIDAWTFDEL
jgi:hypothetical protein